MDLLELNKRLDALPFGWNLTLWGISGEQDTERIYCARIDRWRSQTGDAQPITTPFASESTVEEAIAAALDNWEKDHGGPA